MGDAAQISCPNQNCQAPNPETHRFCQQCRTPLPKRYLWAVGEGIETYKPGKLLAGRFIVKDERILLDTQPGIPLSYTEDISERILPYLRLFAYQLHIPQVYGKLPPLKKGKNKEIWLLEQAPIFVEKSANPGKSPSLVLMPELVTAWKDSGAVRQLNWLWQIAQLWQPLCSEGVAASLLNPKLLRVEGNLVRLLELRLSPEPQPTLKQLGKLWRQLIPGANSAVTEFLEQLCQLLIQERLNNSEELIAQLDGALQTIGRSLSHSYQIITLTDTGPTRQRNEDACYPPPLYPPQEQKSVGAAFTQLFKPGSSEKQTVTQDPLCIVCDGIGGHEGGNVASNLAIQTVVQQLEKLPVNQETTHLQLITQLENSVCEANDRISSRNDSEGRAERQRMGTTLVMAKAYGHEIYITHIGDSRVYWITRTGCYQVTVDDDVASREVRLGYALYRETLQQGGSGSLVQALGMSSSTSLHPTVQRFVIDEDCIFLLCSDGLSDNDRIEQYWDTEVLPVLEKKVDLVTAAAKLIEIANTQNGHDNVTVGLVYCRVTEDSKAANQVKTASLSESSSTSNSPALQEESQKQTNLPTTTYSQLKTPLLVPVNSAPSLLPLLAGIAILLGLGGLLVYIWVPSVGRRVDSLLGLDRKNNRETQLPSSSLPKSPVNSGDSVPSLSRGSLIGVRISQPNNSQNLNVTLKLKADSKPPKNQSAIGIIPDNTILQVQNKALIGQETWLLLKVCSIPSKQGVGVQGKIGNTSSTSANLQSQNTFVKPGQEGWIKQAEIESYIQKNLIPDSGQQGQCYSQSELPLPISEKKHLEP